MSISQKLTLWITLAVALFGIVAAISYYHHETSVELQQMEGLGATIGPLIEQSLDHYMMTKDVGPLERSLDSFVKIEPITSISLVSRHGVVKASTSKDFVGTKLEENDPRCLKCHEEGMRSIVLKEESILRWVQPVTNKPECHGCHDPAVEHNGVIIIDFSTLKSEHNVKMHILKGGLIFLFALVSASLLLMFLFRSLVISRLVKVIERIGRFKKGDYVARAPVEGNDEITNLEEGFNEMAESINERDKRQALLIAQISESQKQWEETFNSITDLISIQDKDYKIIRANRAFLDYFHLSPEDIRGRHCYEVLHSERPSAACPDVASLTSCQPSFAEIIDSRTNRILEISTFPLCDADGNATGTIHIARDITDERERDMSLTVSERLATLGQMASGLAHELNNPLASVSACAEGLLRRIGKGQSDPALFEEYLKIIEEEASRCRDITSNMLSFVRKSTYDKKDLDLHEMLDNALTIIGLQGRLKHVKVIRAFDEGLPRIHGSEGELRQVFLTVITNAIDAMGERGTLTVATKAENKRVSVAVTDTGQGIPPEHLDKIFQTFFTTKGDKGGVGLGLSIAKKIIESHGGTIEVVSEIGVGSTFTITLPA